MTAQRIRVVTTLGSGQQPRTPRQAAAVALPAAALLLLTSVALASGGAGLVRVIGIHASVASSLAFLRVIATVVWLRSGSLDFRADGTGITFGAPRGLDTMIGIAAGGALASTAWVYADDALLAGATAWRMRGLALVVIAGLVMVAETLAGLRRPAGLRVTSERLSGVRGGPRIDVPWDRLAGVDVSEVGAQRCVRLFAGQDVYAVQERLLGSDATAVAAVIDYLRLHPEQWHLLADGREIVHRVEAEAVQRRRGASSPRSRGAA